MQFFCHTIRNFFYLFFYFEITQASVISNLYDKVKKKNRNKNRKVNKTLKDASALVVNLAIGSVCPISVNGLIYEGGNRASAPKPWQRERGPLISSHMNIHFVCPSICLCLSIYFPSVWQSVCPSVQPSICSFVPISLYKYTPPTKCCPIKIP
jgi:hypothetical protein